MGKDKRHWRKLVKKLRRSKIRKLKVELEGKETNKKSEANSLPQDKYLDELKLELVEQQRLHDLEEEAWKERERQSDILFNTTKAKKEELAKALFTEQERIRLESEEKNQLAAEEKVETERIAKEKLAKQVMLMSQNIFKDEDFNQLLEFLSGDIETPPLPFLMPETGSDDVEQCLYFSRTGACRFFERCRKPHSNPTLSSTILIPNFFSHFSLENLRDDTDVELEYEESEMHKEFLSFYDDVLPEFRKTGIVIQFKVCRNFEPHLRGNLYIQYKTIREAVETYRTFNGRFYNGKQLTLRFVRIVSWRTAICGQFNRGVCLKGKSCNYLHVFRNPSREFISADRDWENPTFFRTPDSYSRGHNIDQCRSSSISRYDKSQDSHWRTPSRSGSESRSSRWSDISPRKDSKRRSRSRSSKSSNLREGSDRSRSRSRPHKHSKQRRSMSKESELSQSGHKKPHKNKKEKKHKKKKKRKSSR